MFAATGSDERAFRHVTLDGLEIDDVSRDGRTSPATPGDSDPFGISRDEIHEESAGNPLFVTSLARQFESHGVQRSQPSRQPLPPPERVMELVVDRLAGLAPETVELLQKAAVTGTEFEFSLLRFVADTDDDRLLDRLDGCGSAPATSSSSRGRRCATGSRTASCATHCSKPCRSVNACGSTDTPVAASRSSDAPLTTAPSRRSRTTSRKRPDSVKSTVPSSTAGSRRTSRRSSSRIRKPRRGTSGRSTLPTDESPTKNALRAAARARSRAGVRR